MDDKIIIYTCLTGNYDMLREPSVINEQFRYIYFLQMSSRYGNIENLKMKH